MSETAWNDYARERADAAYHADTYREADGRPDWWDIPFGDIPVFDIVKVDGRWVFACDAPDGTRDE